MANCQSPEILAAVATGSDAGASDGLDAGCRGGGGDDAQASQESAPAAISVKQRLGAFIVPLASNAKTAESAAKRLTDGAAV